METKKKKNWLIYSFISALLFYATLKGLQSNPETYLWPFVAFMGAFFCLGAGHRNYKHNQKISECASSD